jgi:hypothetical protein
MQDIQHDIEEFCKESLGGCDFCEMLVGDASTRQYVRVQHHNKTYIVCIDPALKGCDLESFAFRQVHQLFSKNGIPVPNVYQYDAALGYILQEDGGDFFLEDYVDDATEHELRGTYETLLETIAAIQRIQNDGSIPFSLVFDEQKLMFEFSYFVDHALEGYFGVTCSSAVKHELMNYFHAICKALQKPEYFVLCHRDYHSRNILLRENDFLIIDFQDARLGLPLYDVVSLLRDSYASLPDAMIAQLLSHYYQYAREHGVSLPARDEFERLYYLSAFQRNVKALGTFGYQISKRGKKIYEQYIGRTIGYIKTYIQCEDDISRPAQIILDCIGNRT